MNLWRQKWNRPTWITLQKLPWQQCTTQAGQSILTMCYFKCFCCYSFIILSLAYNNECIVNFSKAVISCFCLLMSSTVSIPVSVRHAAKPRSRWTLRIPLATRNAASSFSQRSSLPQSPLQHCCTRPPLYHVPQRYRIRTLTDFQSRL